MTTLLLDCSPKKRRSTSSYLLSHLSIPLGGEKKKIKLLPKNYATICEEMCHADAVVLAMPIYVDGVPASVLHFFEYVQQNRAGMPADSACIYAVVNCGFYEGEQTKTCHRIIENWCNRCGFSYMGGIGQGAGEMIGVIRFVNPFLAAVVSLPLLLLSTCMAGSSPAVAEACRQICLINAFVNLALYFIFNLFMYQAIIRLAKAVRHRERIPVIRSTVFCPRFLFVIFADLFWVVRAQLQGVPVWKLRSRPAQTKEI